MIDKTTNECRLVETCEAPLCPLQENAMIYGVWYADEKICRARKFQSLAWVKRQKRIARLGLTADDGFFSVKMLESLNRTTKSLRGADPDDFNSEAKWLKQRAGKRATVSQKRRNSKAKKARELVTTHS